MLPQRETESHWLAQDTAASYVVGALAGLVYLRLLNKSVDQFSSGDLSGGSVGGQTRLLIPVILVLFFNRCASSCGVQ